MERQYVGARYVPVFAEPLEWDNQRSFEALTIVSYLGGSYTSKKAVPSGVLPTNTEYWAQTGNYNAQVEQYRQEVENLKNRVVNVQDYGAKGDGVTDDSDAFQNAVNTGYDVYVPMQKGEVYLITKTITITATEQTIYSDNPLEDGWEKIGCIYSTADILFKTTGYAPNFCNLTIKAPEKETNQRTQTALYLDGSTYQKDNLDANVNGCVFQYFGSAIVSYGRGLNICECKFSFNDNCIDLNYTFDGTGGSIYQQPNTGFRAIRIHDNRFHHNWKCIRTLTGKCFGASIINNVSDVSLNFLESVSGMINSIISNNIIHFASNATYGIRVSSGAFENNIITNNSFITTEDRAMLGAINIVYGLDEISGLIICNNKINNTYNTAIQLGSPCKNSVISNNVIDNANFNEEGVDNSGVITFNNLTDCNISNNVLRSVLGNRAVLTNIIPNPILSGCQIIGNCFNSANIIGTYQNGTKPNNIQS